MLRAPVRERRSMRRGQRTHDRDAMIREWDARMMRRYGPVRFGTVGWLVRWGPGGRSLPAIPVRGASYLRTIASPHRTFEG
ncbi:MAG: hypothetical protein JWR80_4817 [Bradyrhizobium sp.]|nr:hypothetical protein [Bradyrhizobium sp.]